jgi:hypothetical protein
MANTYVLISSNELSSTTSSVTFSNIPQTYTDLVLRFSARSNWDNSNALLSYYVFVNGSYYEIGSGTSIRGNGSAASSSRFAKTGNYFQFPPNQDTSTTTNTFSNVEWYIPFYTVSQKKAMNVFGVSTNNSATAYVTSTALLYDSTSAITSLQIAPWDGSFVSGSSFYLYGINNS